MKNIKKCLLTFLIVVLCVCSLVACGDKEQNIGGGQGGQGGNQGGSSIEDGKTYVAEFTDVNFSNESGLAFVTDSTSNGFANGRDNHDHFCGMTVL